MAVETVVIVDLHVKKTLNRIIVAIAVGIRFTVLLGLFTL